MNLTERSSTDSRRFVAIQPVRILQHRLTDTLQVANKKQRDNAALDAELKAKREAKEAQDKEDEASGAQDATAGPVDLLAAEDDEDVIF